MDVEATLKLGGTSVGSKRKADDSIEHQKKIKLDVEEIIPPKLPELPFDCWNLILSYTTYITPVSMLVSRYWRQLFCLNCSQRLALDLGLPASKASLIPNEAKRVYSKIDIYVLLERATSAAKARDFDLLLDLASKLQARCNMAVYLLSYNIPKFNDNVVISGLRKKHCQGVLYTGMTVSNGTIDAETESEINNQSKTSSFYWFMPNGHYMHVTHLNQTNGYDNYSEFRWQGLSMKAVLKELGSAQQETVNFESLRTRSRYKDWNQSRWPPDSIESVKKWLGIDMDNDLFEDFFPSTQLNSASLSIAGRYMPSREWNGQIVEELEQLMQEHGDDWTKEIEFVASRIVVKLTLMNRVKQNAAFASNNARDEFLALIEHAKMEVETFHNVKFVMPTVHPTTYVDHKETFTLTLSPIGTSPMANDARTVIFNMYCNSLFKGKNYYQMEIPAQSVNVSDDSVSHYWPDLIKLLNLKHLSALGLAAAIAACQPKISDIQ